ncbi:MAG: four helix bundle protein [Anaerolineales bacterium]|nr:four helix bundle protein [Anaerolineales bacterium]
MAIASYRDLEVYQRSMTALVEAHKLALKFPDYERYSLCDQLRRSSKSIPANIAEGYGRRKSAREFKHYLTLALGSSNETIVHLEIARALAYGDAEATGSLIETYVVICKMLYRLIESWHS